MQYAYFITLIVLCQWVIIISIMTKDIGSLSNKICKRVKFERVKRNLSQEQLAELADLNRNTISNLERETYSPSIETVEKLAAAFDMDVLEFIDVSKISLF